MEVLSSPPVALPLPPLPLRRASRRDSASVVQMVDLVVDRESRGVTVVSMVALRGLGLLLTCERGVIDADGLMPLRGVAEGEADRFNTRVGDGALSRLVSTTAGLDSGACVSILAPAVEEVVEGGGKLLESLSADTAVDLLPSSVLFFSRSTCDWRRAYRWLGVRTKETVRRARPPATAFWNSVWPE